MPEKIICKCGSEDYRVEVKADINQHTAFCNSCNAYIQHISHEVPTFYFGKYKGEKVMDVDDETYLNWVIANVKLSKSMKTAIDAQLNYLFSKKNDRYEYRTDN